MPNDFKYDAFLSHSAKDKPVVRELANRLKQDGLRVWLDEWEIQPGDMIGLKIQQGLEHSRTLLMVMSAAYFASEWSTLEHHTLLFRDPTNAQRRFIPLLIENCKLPDIIVQFAYIDWREKSEGAYAKILTACRAVVGPAEDEEFSRTGKSTSSLSPGEIALTNEEIALLLSAADSGKFAIIDNQQIGKWVRAGAQDFFDLTDPAFAAIHVEALESLCNRHPRLVKYEGGILYMLTGVGFKIARSLNSFTTIAHGD